MSSTRKRYIDSLMKVQEAASFLNNAMQYNSREDEVEERRRWLDEELQNAREAEKEYLDEIKSADLIRE